MKPDIPTAAGPRCSALNVRTAPSLRVPVTAGNRELLRWLRAAELSAWEAGQLWGRAGDRAGSLSPQNQSLEN